MKKATLFILGLFLAASAAHAQVPAGSGTLSGSERLKVKTCGKDGGAISIAFSFDANGAWTANVNGDVYSGTSSTTRRVAQLTLGSGSLALLDASLESFATDLCEEPVAVTSLSVTKATLKVNKRGTRAKLAMKAAGTGTGSVTATGTYRIKASGSWQ
jgi:hypothetical protein